ncbi:MAG: hypothetical protein R3E31_18685 [Chloroflexota bacterium]|nr:hypothetical protein [Anaerolineales bacterium]MCA9976542.1 hypothetical protein [Anaerolineales bacterium]MCB8966204.1 hypothetical protein [Ardenticatenaceae bacterium]
MIRVENFEAGSIDKRWQTVVHLVALLLTLPLAVGTNHLFWWICTGFNVWVALCWLLYLASLGLEQEEPAPTHSSFTKKP